MALRIRFQYGAGASLGVSIERLADGLFYDFAATGSTAGTFTGSPTTPIRALPADTDTAHFPNRYRLNVTPTSNSVFLDGDYCVTIHDMASANTVVAELSAVMHNGDDATVIPSGAGADPWSQPLPGSYTPGSAGYLLGSNLDAKISTRLASSSYTAPPSDYQQRGQAVVLPAVAPSWYVQAMSPPTVAQIVSGVWDEPKAGHVQPGSFGSLLDASISSRLAGSTDTPGTTTLLSRLSTSRAAYLDNLNVGGPVASHSDVAAIGNNTLIRIFVPDVVQKPASGSTARIIYLYTYDEQGQMATPDSLPTVTVSNGAGSSRNTNLTSTTMSKVAPGQYQTLYTLNATDPTEQLLWSFTVLQGGVARQYGGTTEVVDIASVDFNATDRANLNSLVAMAGTSGVMVASSCRSGYSLSPDEHAAITADALAALNASIPASPASGSVFDRLDVKVSTRSTYSGGPVASVTAPVTVGQINDKTGYSLAPTGLDAVQVEPGINARQALAPILAACAGVVSGAGTGTISIKGGNSATTRIMAATDAQGDRTAVVLTLPN